ncbi:MAG: ornithine carbamoyltransferase [Patescibacteria group bacterium]
MQHLLHLKDWTTDEIKSTLDLATKIKAKPTKYFDTLKNKTLIMLFQKTSTRTRLSFEAAMTELGGHGIFLDSRTTQLSLSDFRDEIKAIMRLGNGLMFRAKKFTDVQLAASQNQVPVIDACSEKYHPCQSLADVLTMIEHSGGLDKIKKVAWLGIENNVSNTLKLICAKLGIKITIIAPEKDPDSLDEELDKIADATGLVTYTTNLEAGLKDADYVHTDTWINMEFFENGQIKPDFQAEYDRRLATFKPYQLNADLINKYCPKAKIMHCMPCHVDYEISRDAIDHPNAVIFDQAENRLHVQKAALVKLLSQ